MARVFHRSIWLSWWPPSPDNHALYLDNRREMMQWYADYIDSFAGLSPKAKE
ncbi:TPA_asm: hypothetical protein G4D26_003099 [Salmonella enterica subsp. enterica serovar 4,[5],12:b:-]|nr:hypothetical protein [Salmonella enterica subsp. enterica serovar 4,[5],12:b:-]HAE4646799.1 hypothetical protein [Salmonella enterica subsp. enterica serovar 4,[5],12:b:-]